jgi:hypothetical protein
MVDYPYVTEQENLFGEPQLADIREEWDWVKPGVEEIVRDDEFLSLIPEDVFAACKSGAAHLWVTEQGFVITTGMTDTITGERTFLVWLAWAREKRNNVAVQWFTFFEDQARKAGFTKFEVRTRYPKLGSYLQNKLGFEMVTAQYVRQI